MIPGPVLVLADDGGLIGRWSPRIGDPSLLGWLTVAAYLATAWCCREAARRPRPAPTEVEIGALAAAAAVSAARREQRLWRALALAFLLLGINKQLDLQSAFTEIGRMLATEQGWYEQRRGVQLAFMLGMAAVGAAAAVAAVLAARGTSAAARLAVAGAVLVITFVVLRAASFHHVDAFLKSSWLGLRPNWVLELGSIAVVYAATRLQARAAGPRAAGPRADGPRAAGRGPAPPAPPLRPVAPPAPQVRRSETRRRP